MNNLGEITIKQGNPATAKSWFEKAIAADPTHDAPALQQPRRRSSISRARTGIRPVYNAGDLAPAPRARHRRTTRGLLVLALIYYTSPENDKSNLDLAPLVCVKQAKERREVRADLQHSASSSCARRRRRALKEFEQAVELDPSTSRRTSTSAPSAFDARHWERVAMVAELISALVGLLAGLR